MKKKIFFACLPPALEYTPCAAFSALKSILQTNGYDTHVAYWNLSFNDIAMSFLNLGESIYENDLDKLLPILAYLAVENNDIEQLEVIRSRILSIKPQIHSKGRLYFDDYIMKNHSIIDKMIDKLISEIDFTEYLFVGFSSKFYQWIVADVFVTKMTDKYPSLKFVVGGFGTREEAVAFMKNRSYCFCASWGEAEHSIVSLASSIELSKSIEHVPNIAYRLNGEIKTTQQRNRYADLNMLYLDHSDYFEQVKEYSLSHPIAIPIEGGRGCSWKKCRFCFLNTGYKYRSKSNDIIISEIKYQIEKYGINRVSFLDNDIVSNDLNKFENLLDLLIIYRSENNDFSIALAEVVTKGLSSKVIKKISLAGFENIQIGYESPSDNLLSKINKNNTFASNLFYLKWANELMIDTNGVNIIRNLLEESDSDIKEGIDNLYFMRFCFRNKLIRHDYTNLAISASSPYYRVISESENLGQWNDSAMHKLLPKNYVNEIDKYYLFLDFAKLSYNHLWNLFKDVESHYLENEYKYLLVHDNYIIYYKEFYNNLLIKELEFENDSIHWLILRGCNNQIQSNKSLLILDQNCSEEKLQNAINDLFLEGLIYKNFDQTEIVSIINTDLILGKSLN